VSDPTTVADGLDHPLDPRVIPMEQVIGVVTVAIVATGSLLAIGLSRLAEDEPGQLWFLRLVAWAVLVLLATWLALNWPARAYRHTSYRVDEQGIEIRRGVFWRVVINVPRSRVQHIDVSQGPFERRYGLGMLVIYTAGTDHAKVALAGLEHDRALRIREHLLPSGVGDAV
jgi:membrane protein YdbS with pleckstrin-like domain